MSVFILIVASCRLVVAQQVGLDMKGIEALADEWNFANNSRNVESFKRVYADTLLFYTETLSEARAIALKQKLFVREPAFQQRIKSEITCTAYTGGLIKCDFGKEVLEEGKWKQYPSYLLISYQDNRYFIVGESDYVTDRVLGYTLQIGEPMKFEAPDSAYNSIGVMASDDSFRLAMDTAIAKLDSLLKPVDPIVIFPQLSAMGDITVPKGYVFLLVGFLAAGGVIIFIADSVRNRERTRDKAALHEPVRKKRVFRDREIQPVFERFVITLFDPLYFRHRKRKYQPVLADNTTEETRGSDLEFEFNYKETHAKFRVICQYHKNGAPDKIRLFSASGYQLFREAANTSLVPFYLVVGFGGTPDDPRELFLLPADAIKREWITRDSLQAYSKSGMFFYNRVAGRLQ